MSAVGGDSGEAVLEEESVLRWTVHPLVQEPRGKTVALIAIVAGLAVGAGVSFGGIGYGLVTLVVLGGALSRYWLPTRYEVDGRGVLSAHLGWQRRRAWGEFRRVEVLRDGVFLSPFVRPSRLDSFRGLCLRCPEHRELLVGWVRRHVEEEGVGE